MVYYVNYNSFQPVSQYFLALYTTHLRSIIATGDEYMDTHARLRQLMNERNWTEYKLAKESGLSQSTISNLFARNNTPSIPTLEIICRAFGITLAQFFADGNFVELTDEQYGFFNRWAALRPEQKRLVDELIGQFK